MAPSASGSVSGSATGGASTAAHAGIGRTVAWGAVGGVVAALVMAGYAMIAALTYQGTGFFTPLYHIAATFLPGDAMMQSMEAAMAGSSFTFLPGPAILGAVIHMAVGAGYGAAFGVLARMLHLHGAALFGGALVWGLVVFAVSAWIGLPVAAALFGGGAPISGMASMVGYPTFVVEHLIFGAVLGGLLAGTLGRCD